MNDLERDLRHMYLRRESDLADVGFAPTRAPQGLARRVRRRQIGVVLAGVLLTAAVAIGSTAGAIALFRASDRRIPANPTETPTPTRGEPVRPDSLDAGFDVAAAWGEMDGAGWTVWTTDDLSCLAFTSAGGGDYSGQDAGTPRCYNGFDGSDLKLTDTCVYACPVPGHPILYGTVSGRVATVELVLDDGTTYAGTVHAPPPEVTADARVFTVPLDRPWGTFTGTLTATAADGTVLERIRYPWNADAAGGMSMPVTVEVTFASGVPVSAVDGRPSETDRWEIAIWRNASGDWCLGTIYPSDGHAVVASNEPGCGAREELFGRRDPIPIDHADIWWIGESEMFGENARWFRYRAFGTVSDQVDSVRLELGDGQVVEADLYDPPPEFEDMGRLFVVEFRSKDHPWGVGGAGGITWRAVALDASAGVLGSDEISL